MPYKNKLKGGAASAAYSGSNSTKGTESSVYDLVAKRHSPLPHSCFKICKETRLLNVKSQYCEVCGTSVQAHGDLFEARYGAEIALEIAKVEDSQRKKKSNSSNVQERAKELFSYWIKVTTEGKGRTDPFDIDFNSGKSQIQGGHYPSVAQKVIDIMKKKYGVGISVKIASDPGNGPAPCLGDMCRISEHFEDLHWSLLVGVYNQQEECKCITNIHLLKITPSDKSIFFGESLKLEDISELHKRCSDTYMKGKRHWEEAGKKDYLSNRTVQKMKGNDSMLLTPTPKPTRLQCYINSKNFKTLIQIFKENGKAYSLTKTEYPQLYKPILLPTRSARKATVAAANSDNNNTKSRKKTVSRGKRRNNSRKKSVK